MWNTKNIAELQGLNFRDRMAVIRRATDMLDQPKKLVLNLLKLAILIPPFMAIARSASLAEGVGWGLSLLVVYPLLTRPVTFSLIKPHLHKARQALGF